MSLCLQFGEKLSQMRPEFDGLGLRKVGIPLVAIFLILARGKPIWRHLLADRNVRAPSDGATSANTPSLQLSKSLPRRKGSWGLSGRAEGSRFEVIDLGLRVLLS
jgi:hypothetical protein